MFSRFVILGCTSPKSVHKPASVGRFVSIDQNTKKLATTQNTLANWYLLKYLETDIEKWPSRAKQGQAGPSRARQGQAGPSRPSGVHRGQAGQTGAKQGQTVLIFCMQEYFYEMKISCLASQVLRQK